MKTLFVIILLIPIASYSQDQAKVNKVQGKYVFYFNEPANEYDVVFSFKTDALPQCVTMEGIVDATLKAGLYEAGAQSRQFDAILISANERDVAIKFKDGSKDNSLANIKKREGKSYYVYCEPIAKYQVVEKIKVLRANQFNGQCRNTNTMIEEILKDAFKSERKGKAFDAIIVGNDQYHNSIKF